MFDVALLRYPSSVADTSPMDVVDGKPTVPVNVGEFDGALAARADTNPVTADWGMLVNVLSTPSIDLPVRVCVPPVPTTSPVTPCTPSEVYMCVCGSPRSRPVMPWTTTAPRSWATPVVPSTPRVTVNVVPEAAVTSTISSLIVS